VNICFFIIKLFAGAISAHLTNFVGSNTSLKISHKKTKLDKGKKTEMTTTIEQIGSETFHQMTY
jgi:hypothetical protein